MRSSLPFYTICLITLLFVNFNLFAQQLNQEQLDEISRKYADSSFPLLKELLSIPNDAFYPADIEKNVQWCELAFAERGFTNTRIETETVPLLLAERKHSKAKKTVLVYLQIDGQPVDSTRWFQVSPYTPTLKRMNATVLGLGMGQVAPKSADTLRYQCHRERQ